VAAVRDQTRIVERKHVVLIQLPVRSVDGADAIHAWNLRIGFEGTIYRTGQSGYRPGRDRCLMKRMEGRGSGFVVEREFKLRQDGWG
jgi:hypothetical protein